MQKKIKNLLIAIFVLSTFLNLYFSLGYAQAMDTSYSDYTEINSYDDFRKINNDLNGKYILTADIHIPDEAWIPIGSESSPFTGVLNGNNFAIIGLKSNLTANVDTAFGLFGYIENASIYNVLLFADICIDVSGTYMGLICGYALNSEIKDCLIYGKLDVKVTDYAYVGGIAGYAYSNNNTKIINCVNNACISVEGIGKHCNLIVGGIAGNVNYPVIQCANNANIYVVNSSEKLSAYSAAVGGTTGINESSIIDCYNTGNLEAIAKGFALAGGITGSWYQTESISNLYNTGIIFAKANSTEEGISQAYYGAIAGITESPVQLESLETVIANKSFSVTNCYYLDNMQHAIGEEKSRQSAKQLTADEFCVKDSFPGFDFNNIWKFIEGINTPVLSNEKLKSASSLTTKTGKTTNHLNEDIENVRTIITLNDNIDILNDSKIKGINAGESIVVAITENGEVFEYYITVEYSLFWIFVDLLFGWLM